MYELEPAIEHAIIAQDRIMFSSPAGGFTIIDKAGLVGGVLDCLKAGQPIERAFGRIDEDQDRAQLQEHVLNMLIARGIVRKQQECQAGSGDILAAWLGFVGVAKSTNRHVQIIGEGGLAKALITELNGLGLNGLGREAAQRGDEPAGLIVCCQDRKDMKALRAANAEAVAAGVPFLPVCIDRHIIAIGPVTIPGATACVECMYQRERMNAGDDTDKPNPMPAHGTVSDFALRFAAMLAAGEAARFLSGAIYDLHIASLVKHSLVTGRRTTSVILKVPRCPVCGPQRKRGPLVDTFALYDDIPLEVTA